MQVEHFLFESYPFVLKTIVTEQEETWKAGDALVNLDPMRSSFTQVWIKPLPYPSVEFTGGENGDVDCLNLPRG